jgi:hypothetical protein
MYCYVADLLGFKSMILNLPPEQQEDRVKDWIQLVSEGTSKFKIQKYHLVSDTIFVGAEDSEEGLKDLLNYSKYMLENGIKKSFLLRGAISYGDVTWNEHISYGKSIVDAYNIANDLEWVGTACQHGIIPQNSSLWKTELIVQYEVPMKNGKVYAKPAVIWNVPPIPQLKDLTRAGGLLGRGANEFSFTNLNKIQNTALYSQYVKKLLALKLPLDQVYGSFPLELVISNGNDVEPIIWL